MTNVVKSSIENIKSYDFKLSFTYTQTSSFADSYDILKVIPLKRNDNDRYVTPLFAGMIFKKYFHNVNFNVLPPNNIKLKYNEIIL